MFILLSSGKAICGEVDFEPEGVCLCRSHKLSRFCFATQNVTHNTDKYKNKEFEMLQEVGVSGKRKKDQSGFEFG